jgi:hypothetical protein
MGFCILFLKRRENMKREKRYDIMKYNMKSRSRIEELGKQLELPTELIQNILNNTQYSTEHLSFSLGPPDYPGGFYGTISISDFDISKKYKKNP